MICALRQLGKLNFSQELLVLFYSTITSLFSVSPPLITGEFPLCAYVAALVAAQQRPKPQLVPTVVVCVVYVYRHIKRPLPQKSHMDTGETPPRRYLATLNI